MAQTVKILIIENDTIVGLDLQNLLEDVGYKVSAIASSGKEAIEAASLHKPNLLLSAITLPGNLDGIQVAEQICTQLKIPVVYLASRIEEATRQGAKGVWSQPVSEREDKGDKEEQKDSFCQPTTDDHTAAQVTEPHGYLFHPFEPRQLYSAIEITLYKHQTYQQLKKRKQQLKTILSSMGDIVITTDEDGLITSMNPEAESLIGWNREEALGREISQVFRIINARMQEAIAIQEAIAFEQFQTELTVRQQTEARLQASEQFLRSLYNAASSAIFVVDVLPDGEFRFVGMNPTSEQLTGVRLEDVQGKSPEQVFQPDTAAAVSAHYVKCIQLGTTVSYEECLPFQGRDSWWLTTLTPLRDTNSRIYRLLGNAINITQRKQAEEQISASLREKEVLLKEIHHRVKNNLQVVLSLLDLQAQQTQEQHILAMFQESRNRIQSMALVHEELYQMGNFGRVNFTDYIHRLLSYLFQIYGVNPGKISRRINIEPIEFNIDTAIPCALIINELVSNALKHAFPGNTKGTIWVNLNSVSSTEPQPEKNQFILVVGNDGVGLQESIDFSKKKSFGWQLVSILAAQLEGQLEVENNLGTVFKIRFYA